MDAVSVAGCFGGTFRFRLHEINKSRVSVRSYERFGPTDPQGKGGWTRNWVTFSVDGVLLKNLDISLSIISAHRNREPGGLLD
jgi:hypothetical protein